MCGILGFVSTSGQTLSVAEAETGVNTMLHRGPDEQNVKAFAKNDIQGIFGHSRLSILDLSGGHQPMESEDATCLLTFNGEIYNHRALREELTAEGVSFTDRSDTQVLLKSYEVWGPSCVRKLEGMFALMMVYRHFGGIYNPSHPCELA